jgi:hypothetical protein
MATGMSRVTHKLIEPNGRKFNVIGTGLTIVEARNEAAAKLSLTSGFTQESYESQAVDVTQPAYTDMYSDAVVVLKKGIKYATIKLDNVSNSLADMTGGAAHGLLDPAKLAAFATAWRDGNGDGGYTFHEGYYTR